MIIYKTTNLLTSKNYVGKDSYNNPNYFGSGTYLCRAIKKYGKENFKKEIICECSSQKELNEKEEHYIKTLNSKVPNGYNLTNGGEGSTGFKYSKQSRNKMRESRLKWLEDPENKKKMFEEKNGRLLPGNIPWNKGKKGVQLVWNKGLTKEIDSRILKYAKEKVGTHASEIALKNMKEAQQNRRSKEKYLKSLVNLEIENIKNEQIQNK